MDVQWMQLPNIQQRETIRMVLFTFLPSWLLSTLLVILLSCIFITWKKSSMATRNNPPSPPRLPIIGNLHQLMHGKSFHQTLWKISQKYGPIMLLHFGSQPYLIISSCEMSNEVLKTHDDILSSRPRSKGFKRLTFNYMDVAFSPSGDHHKKMRKIFITEFLSSKRSRFFKNVTEIEVKGMLDSLSSQPLNSVINLDDTLTNLVTDISCMVVFGKSYRKETFRGKFLKEMLNELVMMLAGSFSDIFPTIGGILDELSGWNSKLETCFSNLDGFFEMVLDEHIAHTNDQDKDLIDSCKSLLTRNEMKALLQNAINGSIDTTTMTMVWAMSEIVKNPRIMQKLQNEIRRCVGRKSSVEESDITKMIYLKLVVKETLRLHSPPPFLLMRECAKHCQIGGYDIFPGTRILINSWGIGRDSRIWTENANEFYPERFEKFEVDHCEMVPFGGGRRACPAINLATSIVEFTLANLLYSFDWNTPGGMKNQDLDMEEEGSLAVRRKTALCLVPIKHNWKG